MDEYIADFICIPNHHHFTLYYYSGYYQGSHKAGLPRLRFFVVPDDFDVRDAFAYSLFSVVVSAVSLNEERPAGLMSVNINFNSSTKKVLMEPMYNQCQVPQACPSDSLAYKPMWCTIWYSIQYMDKCMTRVGYMLYRPLIYISYKHCLGGFYAI